MALAADVLLALAMPGLRLAPGMPLPAVLHGTSLVTPEGDAVQATTVHGTALLVLGAGGALLLLGLLRQALRGVRPRELCAYLLRGALVAGGIALAVLLLGRLGRSGPPDGFELPGPPTAELRTPLGRPPSPLVWVISGALVIAAALAVAWLLRPRRPGGDPVLARLGLEAERAREALAGGEDARGAILACYARMSAALAEGRGIERAPSLTAREFGERLGDLGLPRAPVRDLTTLFEAVRYGRGVPTAAEVARALGCLAPIVAACREPGAGGER